MTGSLGATAMVFGLLILDVCLTHLGPLGITYRYRTAHLAVALATCMTAKVDFLTNCTKSEACAEHLTLGEPPGKNIQQIQIPNAHSVPPKSKFAV